MILVPVTSNQTINLDSYPLFHVTKVEWNSWNDVTHWTSDVLHLYHLHLFSITPVKCHTHTPNTHIYQKYRTRYNYWGKESSSMCRISENYSVYLTVECHTHSGERIFCQVRFSVTNTDELSPVTKKKGKKISCHHEQVLGDLSYLPVTKVRI
jgi:hypothetical protein